MKKNILISVLILLSLSLVAQERGSYLSLWSGMGPTGFRYKMNGIDFATPKRDLLYGGQAGIGYSYYFTKNVGISIGAGISHYRTRAILEGNFLPDKYFTIGNYTDNDPFEGHITNYDLRVRTQNWTEYQSSKFVEIPLMLNLQKKFGEKEYFGLYLSLGAKLQLPFSAKYWITDGDYEEQYKLMISGYYAEDNLELGGFGGIPLPQHAFGNVYNPSTVLNNANGKLNFKFGISAVAEAGILISLSRRVDLALGAFIDGGLSDINKKGTFKTMFTGPETDYISGAEGNVGNGITYNSILNSTYGSNNRRYADNVKTLSYGGKVGLRIKLGKLSQKEEPQPLPTMPSQRDTVFIHQSSHCPTDSLAKALINALESSSFQKLQPKEIEKEKEKEEAKAKENEKEEIYDYYPGIYANQEMEILFEPIYFDLDKATLKPESIKTLNAKVPILKEHLEIKLLVYGNTCDLGQDARNYSLGQQRADAAKQYLMSKGINPERFETSTLSKFNPELPNVNEYNRKHNRRCDFKPLFLQDTPDVISNGNKNETKATLPKLSESNDVYLPYQEGKYYVIVGSFANEKDALRHIKEKKLENYHAKLIAHPDSPRLRVCIGVFNSETDAKNFAAQIDKNYWVLK